MDNFIKGTIERFDGKMAVIKTEDGQTINWPQKNLPDNIEQGSNVKLALQTSENEKEQQEKMAKEILNEILKKD